MDQKKYLEMSPEQKAAHDFINPTGNEWVICQKCNGSGEGNRCESTCRECHGEGEIHTLSDNEAEVIERYETIKERENDL